MSPANEGGLPSPSHHPDLSNEVATLSTKLINAINHQTNLDDSLTATRHDLEAARERIAQLEQLNKEHTDLVSQGILVKKATYDLEKAKLNAALAEEKRQRSIAEQEKKTMEKDLENLSISLFEEANKVGFGEVHTQVLANMYRWLFKAGKRRNRQKKPRKSG